MISAVNGDAVIEDSYVADTVLDVESEFGDALIEFSKCRIRCCCCLCQGIQLLHSSIDNTVTDVESESGDALIEFSEVSDSLLLLCIQKEIQLLLI